MKTVFVLNPKAGKGKGLDKIKAQVDSAIENLGVDAGIYLTKAVGDGEKFAALAASEAQKKGENIRIIACGGDGTFNEILNGIMGYDCASVGIMPIGTGNDFVRNFPDAGDFLDVESQLCGEPVRCDVMKYSGVIDGKEQSRYCGNMFNIGFDCNVVDLTAKLKKYPLIKGSLAYLAAVVGILVKKKGANLRVEIDGEVAEEGPVLLCAIANGSFCGGGVKSSPEARLDDSLMDANIIYNVSRREFLQKFPSYSKGTHLGLSDIDRLLYYKQCKEVRITPLEDTMRLCVDGEVCDSEEILIEMVPQAFNFSLPVKK